MVQPAPGILLIADPFLKDPNFSRTVIFLCEHQDQGSFGFVLNKQFGQSLDQLLTGLEGHPVPLYSGGPVQPDTIHFLHQYPHLIPDSLPVGNDIFWGGNFETVVSLIVANTINSQKIKFFIGYSGWGNGQLNDELREKSWLRVTATKQLVFHTRHNEVWKSSLKHLGGEYEMMINFPTDPQLN